MWLFELWFGHWLQRNSKLFCHGHKLICQNFLVPTVFSKQMRIHYHGPQEPSSIHTYIRHLISHDSSKVRAFGTHISQYIHCSNLCTKKEGKQQKHTFFKITKSFFLKKKKIILLFSNLKNLSETYPYIFLLFKG